MPGRQFFCLPLWSLDLAGTASVHEVDLERLHQRLAANLDTAP
jgi:hypothetical protein